MRAAYQKRNTSYTSLESLLSTSNVSWSKLPRGGASSRPSRKQHKKTDSTESQRPSVYVSSKPQSAFRGMLLLWKWESFLLIVSLVLFIASLVLLREYENKALSHWKAPISINAVIAIITTIFKGSLLMPISNGISQLKWLSFSKEPQDMITMDVYDQASRGAWGSLLYIFKQFSDRRSSSLASFGVLIALLTLITEPFSQAAVAIGICERVMHGEASVPRFDNYAIAQSDATVASLMTAMQLAVYTGLYARPSNSSESIRSTVQKRCHDAGNYILTGYPDILSLASGRGSGFSGKMFTFGTSNGVYGSDPTSLSPAGEWNSTTTLLSIYGIALVKPTLQDKNSDLIPVAFDCALRPCVVSFNASVQNGKYAEIEFARHYLDAVPFDHSFQLATSSAVVNGSRQTCTASEEKTATNSVHVLLPASAPRRSTGLDDGDKLPGKWYTPECVYSFTKSPTSALVDFVGRLFDNASIQLVRGVDQVDGAVWLQTLWSAGTMTIESVDHFMDGISLAIGGEMRSNKPPPSQHVDDGVPFSAGSVTGDALYSEVCIRIKRRYLSFLAVLLTIEMLFFAAVVVISQRRPWWCENWKTSALPLLAQAIRGEDAANHQPRWSMGSNCCRGT
ncbi:hypothetical protein BB8028_0006g11030 [Beauveria bassiana]|uniref:Uncharacterized protein n=1 Tax=Beauveria bassiana TaxID=176275 RepID=A0A2S7YLC5_BEABA|nr:hypothetical protein BB8028_0006g11030 [Beauveria bassiana]